MNYNTDEVKEYMRAYAQMVHLVDTWPAGVVCEETRETVRKSIAKAREFPDELRDESFESILKGLENIVKGLPYDVIFHREPANCI